MSRKPVPQFPIAPILRALGADNVPDVWSGHRKMICPFHADTKPSASVSRFGFKCCACEKSGDAISLLQEEEGLSFADALARAAELNGTADRTVSSGRAAGGSLLEFEGD